MESNQSHFSNQAKTIQSQYEKQIIELVRYFLIDSNNLEKGTRKY
jgi:hypothetical protein